MERSLKSLIEAAKQAEVEIKPWEFSFKSGPFHRGDNLQVFLQDLEGHLAQYEERIVQMSNNEASLESRLKGLVELHDVIAATSEFLTNVEDEQRTLTVMSTTRRRAGRPYGEGDSSADTVLEMPFDALEKGENIGTGAGEGVGFVTGVIERRRLPAFHRVLWRAMRGNVIIKSDEIPQREHEEPKNAFVAFVHGQESLGRVKKICQALGCPLYPVEASLENRTRLYTENAAKIGDVEAVLYSTKKAKRIELVKLADVLEMWHVAILRQKQVFATLNKFSCDTNVATRRCFIAEGWCPSSSIAIIEASLKDACVESGLNMMPVITVMDGYSIALVPPTRFPRNRLLNAFQEMTDAYGVATYGEMNPAVFMVITFPFLFAVMFGDIGHGAIMAAFGAWMVLQEDKLRPQPNNEAWNMSFGGRYVILLMGIFSIYTGLIYNDILSLPISLFPSMFYYPNDSPQAARVSSSYVYPFGIDPAWHHSTNSMAFTNSYKMKQSILFGLFQMVFGLCISLSNMVYFGEHVDIWCTFVPQLLFMTSIFGYLGILVVYKWVTAVDASLLNTLIAMVLGFGKVEGSPIYPGQAIVQTILMVITIACVPWMLFAKPLYLWLGKRALRSQGYDNAAPASSGESLSSTARKAASTHEEHSIGDMMMLQAIHTIEYVLGSISNTASYLRLWALSLAHAQLSAVLWTMTIGVSITSVFLLPIFFAVWASFTLAIMVGMEGMSAFLHALRLHWVEFNNKFYRGSGHKFEPFVLRPDLLLAAALEDE